MKTSHRRSIFIIIFVARPFPKNRASSSPVISSFLSFHWLILNGEPIFNFNRKISVFSFFCFTWYLLLNNFFHNSLRIMNLIHRDKYANE